jgi:hypothetical protein
MSGTYTYTTCTTSPVACDGTPWGTIPNGESRVAYPFAHPKTGTGTCEAAGHETRTCTAGTLSGSFPATSCTNYACSSGGASFQTGVWYSEAAAAGAPWHMCQMDGTWAPASTAPSPNPNAPMCEWAGTWVPRYACGFYEGKAYLCDGATWILSTAGCPQTP